MEELVSVIVPIYNGEKYLSECLDSIVNQTYSNLDICLIDDGSTDRSEEICRHYAVADKRVRYVRQNNQGCSAARNKGLKISRGGYILFVDCDDFIKPQTIETALKYMEEYEADLVQFDFIYWEGDEIRSEQRTHCEEIYSNKQALERMLNPKSREDKRFTDLRMSCACITNKLCKKSVVESVAYPEGKRYEDTAVSHHYLFNASKCVFINDVFYYYRINPEGFLKTSTWRNRLDKLTALEDRICMLESGNVDELIGYAVEDYLGNLMHIYRDMIVEGIDLQISKYLWTQSRIMTKKYGNQLEKRARLKSIAFNLAPVLYSKMVLRIK